MLKKFFLFISMFFLPFVLASCDTENFKEVIERPEELVPTILEPYKKETLESVVNASVSLNIIYYNNDDPTIRYGTSGSGTIIYSSDPNLNNGTPFNLPETNLTLYILTNAHVVSDLQDTNKTVEASTVLFSNGAKTVSNSASFQLVGIDIPQDIAVVKTTVSSSTITHDRKYVVKNILKNDYLLYEPRIGDLVIACGAPLSTENGLHVTRGVITHKSLAHYYSDAPINHGSSGGGLYDAYYGILIGVTSSGDMYTEDPGFISQATGCSIRIDYVIRIIKSFNFA